jgi:DGQHR domain-containing protein
MIIKNREYIKVDLIEVKQKDVRFFVGKMSADDLLGIYTVNPVEYDIAKQKSLINTSGSEEEYLSFLLDEDNRKLSDFNSKGFQRDFDPVRVNSIGEFLNQEEYALFPNTVIVTCDLLNNYRERSGEESFEDLVDELAWPNNLSYLDENNGKFILYVPKTEKSLIIVDGQHRIVGLDRANKGVSANYDILLSFIIGYDRSVIAKLFYTINYTQKSVNKSLLYHLTAEFSGHIDEITFLHELIKVINESSASPFNNRVKMLGKMPQKIDPETKKMLTISQAFLIDYLLYTITKRDKVGNICPIFYFYYKQKQGVLLLRFFARYFLAIKEIFCPQWDQPEQSVLSKTTGIGAFLKILNFFFVKLAVEENFAEDPERIDLYDTKRLVELLKLKDSVTTDLSAYAKAGGAGKVNELMKDLVSRIDYFKTDNYKEFDTEFRNHYVPVFMAWINHIP